jgi:hypothetical protein
VASCEDAGASIVSDHSPADVVTVEARAQFRLKDCDASVRRLGVAAQ